MVGDARSSLKRKGGKTRKKVDGHTLATERKREKRRKKKIRKQNHARLKAKGTIT